MILQLSAVMSPMVIVWEHRRHVKISSGTMWHPIIAMRLKQELLTIEQMLSRFQTQEQSDVR